MKTYTIVITVLFICLCLLGISGLIELRKESDLSQKTIEALRKQNAKVRDSLESQLTVTRDSLNIAFETIRIANAESQKARERSQATIRNLQRIIFITHTDSSRTAELKSLYKSYTP